MSFSQNGLSLIPVHQTASPNGTSRTLLPSLSEMTTASSFRGAVPGFDVAGQEFVDQFAGD